MDSGHDALFGALLRRSRVAAELSQEALAERARLSARGISDLERGLRLPQPGTVAQLLEALALAPEERAALEAAGRRPRVPPPSRPPLGAGAGSATQLVETRLAIPPARAGLVPRARLVERLHTGVRGPLTLVAAPAGYGKTTLVAAWRATPEGSRLPLAWVSLEPGDNDPALFWTAVFTALDRAVPGVGAAALAALRSAGPPGIAGILSGLVNRLGAAATDLVLVLDDYHVIEAEPVHRALAFLLDHLPPAVHLLITTRADPPLPLARLRARGTLTELRADDLRFTPAEAAPFLSEVMDLTLPAGAVEALAARTEGWVAGLQLAALSLQGRSPAATDAFIATFTGSHRHVVDYLVDEVLLRQPAPVQAFLLRTAILDRLSAPLCAFVLEAESADSESADSEFTEPMGGAPLSLGAAETQERLEELERRNVFVVALDDAREWYRYHHLFRDALRQRLGQALAPSEVARLHRRASAWLERHGVLRDALEHALAGGAFEAAARLLAPVGWAQLAVGAPLGPVRGWLEALPDAAVRREPRLCVLRAFLLADVPTMDEMERWLSAAEAALETAGPAAGSGETVQGEITALRAFIAALRGDAPQALSYGEQALELLEGDAVVMRGMVWLSQASAYLSLGDAQRAERASASAAALGRATGHAPIACIAGAHQAYVQRGQGALRQAIATCRETLEWSRAHAPVYRDLNGPLHAALADLLRERNDLDAARQYIDQTVAVGTDVGVLRSDYDLIFLIVLARVTLARGDLAGALAVAREAKERFQTHHDAWSVELLEALEAQVWVAQGNLPAALQWMERAGQKQAAPLLGFRSYFAVYAYEHLDIAPVQVLLAQGRRASDTQALRRALELLDHAHEKAQAQGLPWLRIKSFALQALGHQALGDAAQALAALEQALELAALEGYVRVFLDEGAPMVELLRQAATRRTPPPYVHRLLALAPTL